jgi:hypothetical protein
MYEQLIQYNHQPYIHSKNGMAYNLRTALPQDLKGIQTFTGLGGASHVARNFCTFCSCHR